VRGPASIASAVIASAAIALALALGAGDGDAAQGSDCRSGEIRSALDSFAHAYSGGDFPRLDRIFAPEPRFEWYSTDAPGRRLSRSAKNRATLIPYFRARHERHDRIALRSFRFNGNAPRWGNFQFTLRRRTDGYRGGAWFRVWGKGAASCEADEVSIFVVSLGTLPAR